MDTSVRGEVLVSDTYHARIRTRYGMIRIGVSIIFYFILLYARNTYWIPMGYGGVTFVKKKINWGHFKNNK